MNLNHARVLLALTLSGLLISTACSKQDDPAPDAQPWQRSSDFPGGFNSGAPAFSIGTKGYVVDADVWEFDQTTGVWTRKADMPYSTDSDVNAFSFAIGGKGYVGTGGSTVYSKDVFEYDPVRDSWTKMKDFPASARYGTTSFAIGDKGYVIGGDDHTETTEDIPNSHLNEVWEYTPATDAWVRKADFPGGGRSNAVAFVLNGKGYLGTGHYTKRVNGLSAGVVVKDFWEYDPTSDRWTQKADFPGGERYAAVGFSLNDKGYLGTGFLSTNEIYKDWWEYDPAANKWRQRADLSLHPRYACFAFSLGDKGYVGGGLVNYEEYDSTTRTSYFWEYGER